MTARPCTVGLTGGLASGKSTVARAFASRGAAALDADLVVRDLYRAGEAGARVVAQLFGAGVLDADGGVDRAALGREVLADAAARARLEAAIHPLVRARVASWLAGLASRAAPPRMAVVEAALLVETGAFRDYDLLAVVWCRPEQQLERALERGVDRERALALLAAQRPLEEQRALADVVVDNSGEPGQLEVEVERAWAALCAACAGR
jgi:dephospho-CoA kinase